MGNRVNINQVSRQARRGIVECDACHRAGDDYILCGWHENVVVAFTVVEATAATIVEGDTDG